MVTSSRHKRNRVTADQIEASPDGFAIRDTTPQTGQALWDVVFEKWTAPLPVDGLHIRLAKLVYKCSACTETSVRSGFISKHINHERAAGKSHKDASIESRQTDDGMYWHCSACQFKTNRGAVRCQEHIDKQISSSHDHIGASENLIHRFVAQPPVSGVVSEAPTSPSPVHQGTDENGAAQRPARRKRRRSRSKHRGNRSNGK